MSNAHPKVLQRIQTITGQTPVFYEGDILDRTLLQTIFQTHNINAVIHFAGVKAVGESVSQPLKYYQINVNGSLVLLEEMQKANVHRFIFSSSATVYGTPIIVPISEDHPTGDTTNPYGTSKHMVEQIMRDQAKANPKLSCIALRYFNPIGAHPSGLIGEDPQNEPNNLMPYITQVAVGRRACLSVFGKDYPTPDGTGVRDYIHVDDLARGHLHALDYTQKRTGFHTFNLGTGMGYSVLEMVRAFEAANKISIPYQITERRLAMWPAALLIHTVPRKNWVGAPEKIY